MTGTLRDGELDIDGPTAPPRANGELVFNEPWESRAFGMAVSLHHAGLFEWEEFRARLIAEIAAWEAQGHAPETWCYYSRWLAALTRLLAETGLCSDTELEAREAAFAARPAGHDHR